MPMYRALVKVIEEQQKKTQGPSSASAPADTTLAAMAARHGRGG